MNMEELKKMIALRFGFITEQVDDDWWKRLTPMQKSKISGVITKLMIGKAQMDMYKKTNM